MEITKWLCEFFFDNPWHWAGLVVVLFVATGFFPLLSMSTVHHDE